MDNRQILRDIIKNHGYVHMIGIGGISMRGLAAMLHANGVKVSGSDRAENAGTDVLKKTGIEIFAGHSESNIKSPDAVIYTAAISSENPEFAKAKQNNIPLITRAEALGVLMDNCKRVICFSGTHGKTTTSSMAAHITVNMGLKPSVMIGGEIPAIGGAYSVGTNDLFIAEACEYCNSFHNFKASTAVILNVEYDHPDFFKNIDDVKKSFAEFAEISRPNATVVVNADDKNTMDCVQNLQKKIVTFGMSDTANVYPCNIECKNQYYKFDIMINKNKYAHVDLQIPGEHNIKNTLACAAALYSEGVGGTDFEKYANTFSGPARRFQKIGEYNGALIVDDYAHHPSEIAATLKTAESMDFKHVFCIFQPHTYSRTKSLINDFVKSLSLADNLILADIYAAREKNDNTCSSELIADQIENAKFFNSFSDIAAYVRDNAQKGDLILTMGAGDVNKIGRMIMDNN